MVRATENGKESKKTTNKLSKIRVEFLYTSSARSFRPGSNLFRTGFDVQSESREMANLESIVSLSNNQQAFRSAPLGQVSLLIQQFENHPNHDSLTEDLNKTEAFNLFSEKSKELITSMGNTEYFELCEISCELQCPDCS